MTIFLSNKKGKTLVNARFLDIHKGFSLAEKERFEIKIFPYFSRLANVLTTFFGFLTQNYSVKNIPFVFDCPSRTIFVFAQHIV